MAIIQEDDQSYLKLAQICNAFEFKYPVPKVIDHILKTGGNINFQIPSHSSLKITQPHLLGCTPLFIAASKCNFDAVEYLLELGADVTIQNHDGFTALHFVFYTKSDKENSDFRDYFIKVVFDTQLNSEKFSNPRDKNGLSHLHIACKEENIQAVKYFLTNGVDVNEAVKLDSPIKFAGYTPLHFAAFTSNVEIAEILLEAKPDVNIKDGRGMTPLDILFEQKLKLIDPLNLNLIIVDEKIKDNFTRINEIINLIFDSETDNFKKVCVFHVPEWTVEDSIFTRIKSKKFTNTRDNESGLSNFHMVCKIGYIQAVDYFIIKGENIDEAVNLNAPNYAGYTPLHFAVRNFHFDIVKALLKSNANIKLKNAEGLTPLHMLLDQKLKLIDSLDENIIWYKMKLQQIGMMDDIMDLLLDSDEVDDIGLSHFHVACTMKDSSVAEYLIEEIIDIDHSINNDSPIWPGYTALHFAVQCNHNIFKLLINKGANIEATDAYGLTPMDICLKRCNKNHLEKIMNTKLSWRNAMMSNKTSLFDFLSSICDERKIKINGNAKVSDVPFWKGFSLLHLAVMMCRNNQLELIKQYLVHNNIAAVDYRRRTPLHLAFRMNKLEIVKLLFGMIGKFRNLIDDDGLSYLHIAFAIKCQTNFVDWNSLPMTVFEGKHSIGLIKPQTSLLHLCIEMGKEDIIQHYYNNYRNTCVRRKANFVVGEMFRFWQLEENDVINNYGISWLHIAIYCQLEDLLFQHENVDVNQTVTCNDPSLFWSRYYGYTPLHLAMEIRNRKKIPYLEILLNRGADILAPTPNGMIPLYKALNDIQSYIMGNEIANIFLSHLEKNDGLKSRLQNNSGITMLHIACCVLDQDKVEKYLNKFDVNSKVHDDSGIWQGFTPLHVLLVSINDSHRPASKSFAEILRLLLKRGADVTATDKNGDTPIHLAFHQWKFDHDKVNYVPRSCLYIQYMTNRGPLYGESNCSWDHISLDSLLNHHKDFSINPTSSQGVSHFHVACFVKNVKIIQQFLKNGADVNKPIDFFAEKFSGLTPLDLSLYRWFLNSVDETKISLTIDLLIEYGSNISTQDSYGYSPFHRIMHDDYLDNKIVEKFVRNGAVIDSQSIFGETPLEIVLRADKISPSLFDFFKKSNCQLNSYNRITEEGYLSIIDNEKHLTKADFAMHKDILKQVFESLDLHKSYENGKHRSNLHNAFTREINNINHCKINYHKLLKESIELGIDIDLQDETGKTALHLASKFQNSGAVEMLLKAGADVNILDFDGNSAMTYAREGQHKNLLSIVTKIIAKHLRFLEFFDLHINKVNNRLIFDIARPRVFDNEITSQQQSIFLNSLEAKGDILIDKESNLYLRYLLSEKIVSNYYWSMTMQTRLKVEKFFNTTVNENKDFVPIQDIANLQWRKIKKRPALMRMASGHLTKILNFQLPELCVRAVFDNLQNWELENIILATSGDTCV